jgi:hypothetical protein
MAATPNPKSTLEAKRGHILPLLLFALALATIASAKAQYLQLFNDPDLPPAIHKQFFDQVIVADKCPDWNDAIDAGLDREEQDEALDVCWLHFLANARAQGQIGSIPDHCPTAAVARATLAGATSVGAGKLDWDRFIGMTEAQFAAAHSPFKPAPARDRTYIATLYGQQGDVLVLFLNGCLDQISFSVTGRKKVRAIRDGLLRAYNVVLTEGTPDHACVSDDQYIENDDLTLLKVILLGIGPQCPPPQPEPTITIFTHARHPKRGPGPCGRVSHLVCSPARFSA